MSRSGYDIQITRSAQKELEKVDGQKLRQRIVTAIYNLAAEPRPVHSKKMAGVDDTYRIRVGDYRVVYSIHDQMLLVEVIKVGHRRHVYR